MDTLEITEVGLADLQTELQLLQTQLENLTYQQELTNTIMLFILGVSAAAVVCVILYNFLKILM